MIDFIRKEWLLFSSAFSFLLTTIYTRKLPAYSISEIQILLILFVLFVSTNGIYRYGLISKVARIIDNGKYIVLKLILVTFFIAMLVTNDVALIVIVPLTLLLGVKDKGAIVILEVLSANAGSALTPFGNPQNLYIYWFYGLSPLDFVAVIAPFSFTFLLLFILAAFFIKSERRVGFPVRDVAVTKDAWIYSFFLLLIILTVLHLLPLSVCFIVLFYVVLFDRKILHIDYFLLLTFVFFFGLADNLKVILQAKIFYHEHVFLLSALLSQLISNVPTTLLLAKFTTNWQALLWGVNSGGFGGLLGSLANLIAYKIYVSDESTSDTRAFTIKFIAIIYTAFLLSIGLYFLMHGL